MKYPNATLWYVVFLLTLASTLSFIDRQILNVMIGPIKRDLGGLVRYRDITDHWAGVLYSLFTDHVTACTNRGQVQPP